MTDHRLVRIRLVLLVAIGVTLFGCGWLLTGISFVAFGLMMPPLAVASCGNCTSTFANQYQIVIAGIFDFNTVCSTPGTPCTQYNGTYTVTEGVFNTAAPATQCQAYVAINPCYCYDLFGAQQDQATAVQRLALSISVSGANSIALVSFNAPSSGSDCHVQDTNVFLNVYSWQKTFVGGADCNNWSSESIPHTTHSGACRSDGTPALVTKL